MFNPSFSSVFGLHLPVRKRLFAVLMFYQLLMSTGCAAGLLELKTEVKLFALPALAVVAVLVCYVKAVWVHRRQDVDACAVQQPQGPCFVATVTAHQLIY